MEKNKLENIEIFEDRVIFSLNPVIYPIDVVQRAAYICLDDAQVNIDGDPEKRLRVELVRKNNTTDIKQLVEKFSDNLINYYAYKKTIEENKEIRELLYQKILMTNVPKEFAEEVKKNI